MANTNSTPVTFFGALKLVALLLFRPSRFLERQAENNAVLNAVKNPQEIESALVVRHAFFSSLILVASSAAFGYVAGLIVGWLSCASPGAMTWLQIIGTSLLLWGTLFIRGWEIQSYGGVTLTERVNQWIYRTLYCVGTSVLVSSLALQNCK